MNTLQQSTRTVNQDHAVHILALAFSTDPVARWMLAHAAVRGIEIQELESELEGDIDLRGFLGLAGDVPKGFTDIRMKFKVKTDEQSMKRLKSLAAFFARLQHSHERGQSGYSDRAQIGYWSNQRAWYDNRCTTQVAELS
jgi:hypothetical protein